ncbi:restriction endonuclease subunit S [Aeriscardovia aeriphila]|uniref:Type I restriction modification DNA specificity protein n=1 Tax=Aeriscardovia aeriphila TaxID=218139 RepID=A0A261F9Y0_9BIFI|nr:restriction endonuclease subunit S [Aeriscardovia aeriphila]NYI26059.1 hypothetical protein [Aeriscardovia aeriphila]OZG55793.1 type I restriction modification DNA specificity protein [Aeriscardovia aeriphila]
MKLDTTKWKWFQLGGDDGLFDIRKGKRLTSEDQTEGNTPYIGAIDSNNGVSNYIGQEPIHEGNTISLSYNGSVGEAFYQPTPYWATDDVNALYLRPEHGTLSPATGLFVCAVLKHDKYRYSYGRKWTLDNMTATKVKLPATSDGKPDWQWMELYISSLHSEPLKTRNAGKNTLKPLEFDIHEWREFRAEELFDSIYKVAAYDDSELEQVGVWNEKVIPYVTRTDLDNSVKSLVVNAGLGNVENGNAIVIGDTTSTISYQPGPFVAGEHIIAARADWMNKYTGLFITCLLRRERYRYSYGRAFKLDSIRNTELRLPVTSDGVPDWQWMENYIKSLPYGDRL